MKLTKNVGESDRTIRGVIGIGLMAVALLGLQGGLQILVGTIGIVVLITGIVGYCGIYSLLGIHTCPVQKKGK